MSIRLNFMTTRRRSTAKKSAKVASPVRKSPVTEQIVSVKRVNKVTPIREIKTMTETQTPATIRPEKPNLSWSEYREDVKVRWEIHSWETQELWKDLQKGYQSAKPFVIKTVNYCKDSYNRAFNQDTN